MIDLVLRVVDPIVGVVLIGCGAVLWVCRPRSLVGPIMVIAGGCWFIGSMWEVALFLHRGPLVHLHISYPTGRLRRPVAIVTVVIAYAVSIGEALARNPWVSLGVAGLVAIAAIDIFARTSGRARKAGGPALAAALAFAGVIALSSANQLFVWEADRLVAAGYDLVICGLAVGLTADLLWGRWTEATIADLVTQLGARPDPSDLRGALRRALGDPTAEICYWMPERRRYVDDSGADANVPNDARRAVIVVEEAGQPVAVLVHDAMLTQDNHLIAEVTAALRLALGNARLKAQVQAQLSDLAVSRRRLVEAADAQRQRMETDLIGGPQLSLTEMTRQLQRLHARSDTALQERLQPLLCEATLVRDELRELAHGIRPPALEKGGLANAVPLLAARIWPTPVRLDLTRRRFPPAVEGAVYFVCAEALTNVAKHARATQASIRNFVDKDMLVAQITDNGVGGAKRTGSGLRGLADRVEALDGQLTITSLGTNGTVLTARIPLQASR